MFENYTFLESKIFLLSPTSTQKNRFDSLFNGLICVFDLITHQKHNLKNKMDIKTFLLINKNKIDCHIHMLEKEIAYSILVEVIFQWINAEDFPKHPTIDFDEKCSVSNQNKLYLPIARLGLVDIHQTYFNVFLESIRGQNKKYDPYFSIFKKGSNFFIEIDLLVREKITEKNPKNHRSFDQSKKQPPSSNRQKNRNKNNIKSSKVLSLFDKMYLEADQKARETAFLERQYVTSNFKDLSGRPVSAGLPSLGKRK